MLHCNANERKRISRRLFLSFDDGPSPNYTDTLLDLLAAHQIRASFFVVAESAEKNPRIRRARQRLFDDTCLCGAGFPKITDDSS